MIFTSVAAWFCLISGSLFLYGHRDGRRIQGADALLFTGIGIYVGGLLANHGVVRIPADIFGISGVSLTLAGLYANRFQGTLKFWAGAALVSAVFFLIAVAVDQKSFIRDEPHRVLLALHIGFIFAAAGFLLFLGLISSLYLFKESALRQDPGGLSRKLPSLDALDRFQLRSLQAGFVLLTIGSAFGIELIVSTDKATTQTDVLAAITSAAWLLMAGCLYLRLWRNWRGHRMAVFSVSVVGTLFLVISLTFGFQIGVHGGS